MITTHRVLATLSLAVVVGGGGYWAGTNNIGSAIGLHVANVAIAADTKPMPQVTGDVIYYRHPDGLQQYSATARSTDDGRAFVAVRASEDVVFADGGSPVAPAKPDNAPAAGQILYYRNPMGLADTSKVPKKDSMGMDYIPVFAGDQADPSTVKVSLGKLQRTGVKSVTATMATISRDIRVPGTVTLDERLVSIISMRTDAFVDDVANVTTGDRIAKGENLFRYYSKEIATAGAEYASAKNDGRSDPDKGTALRLRNLGVSQATIETIAQTHQVPTSISYPAPRDGVILDRMATAGMMAKPGDILFRIADISNVWVLADVPEYDLSSVKLGAEVAVTIRSLPGKTFKGSVDLIYPQVQEQTRTTKVRVELPNPDGVLMANMYADVDIEAGAPKPVVSVPNSSVIDTGNRQVVIVDKGDGKFEPKDVKLGVRGEDQTEIVTGIAAGDQVVTSANFLLDAESNLNSALSGMTTDEVKP